jgi:hypothetical protein
VNKAFHGILPIIFAKYSKIRCKAVRPFHTKIAKDRSNFSQQITTKRYFGDISITVANFCTTSKQILDYYHIPERKVEIHEMQPQYPKEIIRTHSEIIRQ